MATCALNDALNVLLILFIILVNLKVFFNLTSGPVFGEYYNKATGKIAIQGGVDFVPADSYGRKEAGQGDWKFETNDVWDTISYSSYSQTVSLLESNFSTQACRHMIKENQLYVDNMFGTDPIIISFISLNGTIMNEKVIENASPNDPWIEIILPKNQTVMIIKISNNSNQCTIKLPVIR